MFQKKSARKRWRLLLRRFAIAYSLICVAFYFQQKRLLFFPTRTLKHDPSLYQMEYQDVWISISNEDRQAEKLHENQSFGAECCNFFEIGCRNFEVKLKEKVRNEG